MTSPLRLSPRNLARYLIGALFCWAAVSKLANQSQFFGDVLAYQLPVAEGLVRATVIVLPWVELLCGLMLFAGFQLRAALGWCLLLFATFAGVTGQAWARGLNISCGCFDLHALGLEGLTSVASFVDSAAFAFFRALAFFAVSLWLWRTTPTVTAPAPAPASA